MPEENNLLQYIHSNALWENELTLKRGDYIDCFDKTNTNIYFIAEGCLRIYWVNEEKEEQTIRFGYTHNIIAALDSFILNSPSDFHILALRKTQIKVLSKTKFEELLSQHPQFKEEWILMLQDLIIQQLEREKDLLISSPTERYKRVLQRSPQLFQEVPNKYIADYLRMTPETLSRIMNS